MSSDPIVSYSLVFFKPYIDRLFFSSLFVALQVETRLTFHTEKETSMRNLPTAARRHKGRKGRK